MALTTHAGKGSELTWAEADANFTGLADGSLITGVSTSVATFIQAGTGAVSRTGQAKLRDIVSVKDFGAVGDGITDDTTAILAAIAALPTAGGTLLYDGQFLFSSTITITNKIRLIGGGGIGTTTGDLPSSYFLKSSALAGNGIVLAGSGSLMVGGGVVGQVGNTGDNIVLLQNSITCRDVTSVRAGQDGFRVGLDTARNCNAWVLDNCHAYSNVRRGFYIHSGTTDANSGNAIACQALSNGEDGFYNDNATLNTYTGCLAESNTGKGLHFGPNAISCVVVGGDREANTSTNLLIDAGAQYIILMGNFGEVTDNSTTGMMRPDRLVGKMGTWTPVLIGSTTPGTQTYATQTGNYIRMGDMIFISMLLVLSAFDAATAGNIQITGLPFTLPSSFTNFVGAYSIGQWGGFTFAAGYTQLNAQTQSNDAIIRLLKGGSAKAAAFVVAGEVGAAATVYLSGWFPVSKY